MTPSTLRPRRRPRIAPLALAAVSLLVVACGGTDRAGTVAGGPPGSVRLGFFPNVTHTPALVGVAEGTFSAALGEATELETFTFDAGTEAAEALLAGSLDLTFIGPNPAINAFAQSGGEAVRIVAGSTSGGAFLVVREGITSAADLEGLTIATPSLGNTQDVALRAWLKENGFETTPNGGGDVIVLPQKNSTTLESFINGDIDGAWVPEPWATRLVSEGGGVVLVNERDLWTETGGEFVTTHLLVRTEFLEQHPDTVAAIIEGLAAALDAIEADPAAAQADVIAQIASITGTDPDPATIAAAFGNLTFTLDPIAASLATSAADATSVGLLGEIELDGLYALDLLNALLAERGESPVVGL
ncbi:MAG: ABC transporter substrate-binding protein [Ilumatobacteraceae bacterium]